MNFKDISTKVTDIDEKGIVSIYVNGFNNIDSDGDVSSPTSFNKTISDGIKRVKHLKDHNRYILLGLPDEMKADNYGLLVRSKMNIKKQVAKDVYEDYKFFAENNRTLEHSIGYEVIKSHKDKVNGEDVRVIDEYKLYEYSTLSFLGANENTPLVDLKTIKDISEHIELLTQMINSCDYTEQKVSKIIETIDKLKSLINEPEETTQKDEPNLVELFQSKLNFINK